MEKVRTRFAPSPTGFMHVGGIRTALFAWLLAKQANGQFILRIEDTDKKREVAGSEDHIIRCLKALSLNYDEGPDQDGPFGPYRQSERLDLYRQWAEKLIQQGRAYADPYQPDELDAFRLAAQNAHQPFLYRNHRPDNPPQWDGKTPLRFKSDPKPYSWTDLVMGKLSAGQEAVDDFILIKSDGFPTYNFAHIVDDYEMQISHIIRGQEFIASVPNYLNLYEALDIKAPLMATPPPVLGPSGTKKLSKRDGAKDILEYIQQGYLTSALLNFIASLGWNDGTTQEIYSVDELIHAFKLERIQRGGARFDERRLLWMDGQHIRRTPIEALAQLAQSFWPIEAASFDDKYKHRVLELVQERLKYLGELPDLSRFFFIDLPIDPSLITDNKYLKDLTTDQLKSLLEQARNNLQQSDFDSKSLNELLNRLCEETGQKPAVLFSLIRIATTQAPASPALADSLALLGKERVIARIDQQLNAW